MSDRKVFFICVASAEFLIKMEETVGKLEAMVSIFMAKLLMICGKSVILLQLRVRLCVKEAKNKGPD